MSPTPPPSINPSHAVKRIREIIVGRHLEKLEQHVVRLDSTPDQSHRTTPWEARLCNGEARLDALQDNLRRLADSTRENAEIHNARQRAEIRRLANQIQQVAAARAAENAQPAIDRLESKIGTWLTNWQDALQSHLNEREQRLSEKLRNEAATLWENTESQITRLQSHMMDRDRIEERFNRIAAAARALAECAAPSSPEHSPP